MEKIFAKAKKFDAGLVNTAKKAQIDPNILNEKFKTHFNYPQNVLPPEITSPENFPELQSLRFDKKIDESYPTNSEIRSALKKFKNNKCQGSDKIWAENLKYAEPEALILVLEKLLKSVWDGSPQPDSWKYSTISGIFKNKGSRKDKDMYRGISVGSIISKILPMIILSHIADCYESIISSNQYGFRAGRSTTDGIFILKNLIDKAQEPFVCTFIDLKAAYDWVNCDQLIKIFEFRTGASKIAKILAESFRSTTAKVNGASEIFLTLSGLKQGALESPVLFNFFFDFCIQIAKFRIKEERLQSGIELPFNIKSECLGPRNLRKRGDSSGKVNVDEEEYADDLVIVSSTVENMKKLIKISLSPALV